MLAVITSPLALVGCNAAADKSAAEKTATGYFEAVKARDYELAASFHSDRFYQQISRDQWLQEVQNLVNKFGDLQSYQETGWSENVNASTSGGGTTVLLTYKVTYANYPAVEVLNLRKAQDGTFAIDGQHIDSPGLLP